MREITKILTLPLSGTVLDFRLTELDAFSGVSLLRLLSGIPGPDGVISAEAEGEAEKSHPFPPLSFFAGIPDADLRSLMTTCLQHAEVLLPAGWMPVMTRGEWTFPELEHDTAVCLKLTIEEITWTLEGFFGERVPDSRPGTPAS